MKKEYITIPNAITFTRLVGAILLIFLKPLGSVFLVIYSISGFTDAIDGFVARKMGGETDFGSKLDSVADLTFYTVMMLKILPFLVAELPGIIWYCVGAILIFRVFIYVVNAFKDRKFLTSHSYLNKASGLMMFALPYFIKTKYLEPYAWMVVGITGVAAIYEFTYSLIRKS